MNSAVELFAFIVANQVNTTHQRGKNMIAKFLTVLQCVVVGSVVFDFYKQIR